MAKNSYGKQSTHPQWYYHSISSNNGKEGKKVKLIKEHNSKKEGDKNVDDDDEGEWIELVGWSVGQQPFLSLSSC